MELISEAMRETPSAASAESEFRAWATSLTTPRDAAERALSVFEILTAAPQRFLRSGWASEDVFWSRYFWLRVHTLLVTRFQGYDAGLEQYCFAILEHPEPPCDPDWQRLEQVERLAEEAARQCP